MSHGSFLVHFERTTHFKQDKNGVLHHELFLIIDQESWEKNNNCLEGIYSWNILELFMRNLSLVN